MKGNVNSTPFRALRVVVATPRAEQHCELIERLEHRIDLIRDQSLYPPMRHPADFLRGSVVSSNADSATGVVGDWRSMQ
jgi:hypothetical protein